MARGDRDRGRLSGRRRRWPRVLVAVLLVLALGTGVWLVGFSSVFAVREVEVKGTAILTPEAIEDAAAAPIGRPLSRVDERGIGERVATLSPVASVTVKRAWPQTLRITVVEREPRFALERAPGWVLVDADGFAFWEENDQPEGLVAVSAPADPDTLRGVGVVVAALGDLPVDHIEASSPDDIVVMLPKDRRLIMGSGEQAALKVEVGRRLLEATEARFVDVTAPENPSTR